MGVRSRVGRWASAFPFSSRGLPCRGQSNEKSLAHRLAKIFVAGRSAGKVVRIGHIGDLNELMLARVIAGVEMAMSDVGIPIELGSGVAAAQTHWKDPHTPAHESTSSAVLRVERRSTVSAPFQALCS